MNKDKNRPRASKQPAGHEAAPITDKPIERGDTNLICKHLRDIVGEVYEAFLQLEASLEVLDARGGLTGAIRIEFECDILRFRSMEGRLRTALAALTIPVNEKTAPKLIRLAARVRELDKKAKLRNSALVFAPIRVTGEAGGGFGFKHEAELEVRSPLPVDLAEGEWTERRDEADPLAVRLSPLLFPDQVIESTTSRRETA